MPSMVADVEKGVPLPPPAAVSGAVITGSHAMVSDCLPWSEYAASWLRSAYADYLPLLGICYGHQLLAHASGGHCDYRPKGREVGTAAISRLPACDSDPLFDALPAAFAAHTTHSQSVL